MKKPQKPQLQPTGITVLNKEIQKIAFGQYQLEGGVCPMAHIDDVINTLHQIQQQYPSAVLITSKRSLYVGILDTAQYQQAMLQYQKDLQLWKELRKKSLLKQLQSLDNNDNCQSI